MRGEAIPAGKTERGLPLLSHATRASPRRSPFKPQSRTVPIPPTRPYGTRTQRARRKFIPFLLSEKLLGTQDAAIYPRYGARTSRLARRAQRYGWSPTNTPNTARHTRNADIPPLSKNFAQAISDLNPWVIHPRGNRVRTQGLLEPCNRTTIQSHSDHLQGVAFGRLPSQMSDVKTLQTSAAYVCYVYGHAKLQFTPTIGPLWITLRWFSIQQSQ